MNVDLKILETYGKTAVHCTSEDHAKLFMDAMWDQYPHLVSGIWGKGQTNWERYKEVGHMYFLPRIVRDPDETPYCQSSSLSRYEKGKYEVVELTSLFREFDLGELPEPGLDLNILFGAG